MKTIIESVEGRKYTFIFDDRTNTYYLDCLNLTILNNDEKVLSNIWIKKDELKRLGKSLD